MKPAVRKTLIMLSAVALFAISVPLFFLLEERFSYHLLEVYLRDHAIAEDVSFSAGNSAEIRLNPTTNELFYLACIPSEASALRRLKVSFSHFHTLEINGQSFHPEDDIYEYVKNHDDDIVTMRFYALRGELLYEGYLQFIFSDSVPSVYLTMSENAIAEVDSTERDAEIKPRAKSVARLINADGSVDVITNGNISRHGNTSFDEYSLKSYNLSLPAKTQLFGMSPAKKWVLKSNGQYATVLLKNEIAYKAARETGSVPAPDSRFVNLYINGRYNGLYQLTQNVQAPEMLEKRNAYALYEYDTKYLKRKHWFEYNDDYIAIHYPEDMPDAEERRLEELFLTALDRVSEDGDYESLIDMDSFLKMYMLLDFFVQTDVDGDSLYFYLSDDGKIHAGPVWDFDCTCGHLSTGANHEELEVRARYFNDFGELFFGALEQSPRFRKTADKYYREKFSPLMHSIIDGSFSDDISRTGRAAYMSNFLNSVNYTRLGDDDNAEDLKDWLSKRLAYLDRYYGNEEKYSFVKFHFAWGSMTTAEETGLPLGFLPCDDDEYDTESFWGRADGFRDRDGNMVDQNLVITGDTDLFAVYDADGE